MCAWISGAEHGRIRDARNREYECATKAKIGEIIEYTAIGGQSRYSTIFGVRTGYFVETVVQQRG